MYIGTWKNGLRHGQGKQYWPDGSIYIGQWVNSLATGKGRLYHSDGDVYEGDWLEDKVKYKIINN